MSVGFPAATGTGVTVDWAAVVRRLDSARARALTSRNPLLLDAVYTRTAAARSTDAGVIADMVAAGVTVSGADHRLESAAIQAGTPIRLLVRDSLPAYSILDLTGRIIGTTTARNTATRVLVLVATVDGYLIDQVRGG